MVPAYSSTQRIPGNRLAFQELVLRIVTPTAFREQLSEFRRNRTPDATSVDSPKRQNNAPLENSSRLQSSEEKNALIAVQWLVAIATSYLIFAAHDWDLTQSLPALLITVSLASAAILRRLPEQLFQKRLVEPGLLVLDSVLIVSAITILHDVPWDLLVLFLFCVLIAAIGENIIHIAVGCVLLSLVFLAFVSPQAVDLFGADSRFLFRVPFIFGISISYGHLASQVKREKTRLHKLKEATILKRQLVAALAHDIKAPLNVILGHTELLAGEYGGRSTQEEKFSSLKCVRDNIDRILNLITDFLDVSKLETFTPQFAGELVQMNSVVQDVVLQQMVLAREKNISLALDVDPNLNTVVGDDNQLQRAVWNLVANAIKFTPSGGTVTVITSMRRRQVVIQVKDTGIGIPKEDLPKLFSEFQRLQTAAQIEGSGLGLFIVKSIVEAHHGKVTVESEAKVGSMFTISLPAHAEPLNNEAARKTDSLAATGS